MRNVVITILVVSAIGACFAFAALAPNSARRAPQAAVPGPSDRAADREAIAERHFFRGEYAPAIESYRVVVVEQPDNALAWARLAYATHAMGQYEAAVEVHKRAAGFDENRAASLFKLGCALARLGRPAEAIDALNQSIENGYRDRNRAEHEEDLDSIRDDERFALLLDRMAPPLDGTGPLDFWSGTWSVRDPESGRLVGSSIVLRVEDGRLFDERLSDFRGVTDRSMTYLDPSDGLWKMLRVSNRGEVQRLEGSFEDGVLTLSGDRVHASGRISPARVVIERRPDGRILQTFLDAEHDGASWEPSLEFLLVHEDPIWFGGGRGRR